MAQKRAPHPHKKRIQKAVTPTRRRREVGTNSIEQLLIGPGAPALYEDRGLVERVVSVLGSNTVAKLLGVSRSQPSRWRSGEEQMSPLNRARLTDLDHVLNRLLQVLWPEEAGAWLTAVNPHLGGRPVDVLALRGSGLVIEAIDALAQGAYA
ncbi:MAG: antitoxin Xre/MbcA/ParS toxin-binding domain-containing protein [Acidimicrobiia bacterium]